MFRWLLDHPGVLWLVSALGGAFVGVIVAMLAWSALARIRRQRARRGEGVAPYRADGYPRPYRTGESPYRNPQRWGDR